MNCCKYSERSHHKDGPQVAFVGRTQSNIGWHNSFAGRFGFAGRYRYRRRFGKAGYSFYSTAFPAPPPPSKSTVAQRGGVPLFVNDWWSKLAVAGELSLVTDAAISDTPASVGNQPMGRGL